MNLGICGDVHWSVYSSILRSRGTTYSTRLENLIKTINWVENLFKDCDEVIYLGDFFDRSDLTAEEITALKEVVWNNKPHHFIVGNHESNISTLFFNSTKALNREDFYIEDKPRKYLTLSNLDIYFLPYIIEDNRKELITYLDKNSNKKIIFSHNDLKGIRYGAFQSVDGFEISEIEDNCELFINGHLHNGGFVNDKETILNLGNITGQNFSEDAYIYPHYCCTLNTDNLDMQFYENPNALNFYKLEIENEKDFSKLNSLKDNAVLSIKCVEELITDLKELLPTKSNIIESKTIIFRKAELEDKEDKSSELKTSDYLEQFTQFVFDKLGTNDIIKQELAEICK